MCLFLELKLQGKCLISQTQFFVPHGVFYLQVSPYLWPGRTAPYPKCVRLLEFTVLGSCHSLPILSSHWPHKNFQQALFRARGFQLCTWFSSDVSGRTEERSGDPARRTTCYENDQSPGNTQHSKQIIIKDLFTCKGALDISGRHYAKGLLGQCLKLSFIGAFQTVCSNKITDFNSQHQTQHSRLRCTRCHTLISCITSRRSKQKETDRLSLQARCSLPEVRTEERVTQTNTASLLAVKNGKSIMIITLTDFSNSRFS